MAATKTLSSDDGPMLNSCGRMSKGMDDASSEEEAKESLLFVKDAHRMFLKRHEGCQFLSLKLNRTTLKNQLVDA